MSEEKELVWGIKNGDIDQVKDIIETQKIDVNVPIDGRVLLHYAADYGQTAVLNYLLDKGADPNMVDKHGISILLAAIWEGHTDCVKSLLKNVNLMPVPSYPAQRKETDKNLVFRAYLFLKAILKQSKKSSFSGKPVKQIKSGMSKQVKGASKSGKTPDGTPYMEAAEKEEIKELLT